MARIGKRVYLWIDSVSLCHVQPPRIPYVHSALILYENHTLIYRTHVMFSYDGIIALFGVACKPISRYLPIPSPKMDRFCPHSTPLECGSFNERFSIDIALRWSAETYLSAKKATNILHPQLKYLHDIKDFRKNLKVFLFITSLNITDQNTLFIRHLFNANSDNWRRY